uniref:Uncharacterized protein n=1 Tax=Oryza meridionalis TaxID=40149 RepID=A0A0E0DM36_9ORYZ
MGNPFSTLWKVDENYVMASAAKVQLGVEACLMVDSTTVEMKGKGRENLASATRGIDKRLHLDMQTYHLIIH